MSVPSWARCCAVCGVGLLMAAAAGVIAQSSTPAPASGAQALYEANCSSCHGKTGHGDGPAAALMSPTPRDCTKGIYKFRTTASGSLPTDEDLMGCITNGLPGTSMLGWKGRLSDSQIQQLAGYAKTFSPRFRSEQPSAITLSHAVPSSPDSIAKGKRLYVDLACAACHGDTGNAVNPVATLLKDDWGNDLRAADLTQPWTFRGGHSPDAIYTRLRTGINGTPMPSFADTAKDPDLWNLANFVATLGRKPTWTMSADELKAQYDGEMRAAAADPKERGWYLARTLGCAHCHSPVDAEGRELPNLSFAGGQKFRVVVWDDVVTSNLTSDTETGIGRYSDDDVKRAITRGIKHDATRMLPFPMGWPAFANLTTDDLDALVKFLRTLPPVSNRIPAPVRMNVFSYLGAKFQMLLLGRDYPMVIYPGNAGRPNGPQS